MPPNILFKRFALIVGEVSVIVLICPYKGPGVPKVLENLSRMSLGVIARLGQHSLEPFGQRRNCLMHNSQLPSLVSRFKCEIFGAVQILQHDQH